MDQSKYDFSSGSVKGRILAQALPLTLAQAVQLLYNVVDRIFIGHLEDVGEMALSGLGVTFPVIVLIAAFTSLFGTGGATIFSIARGEGKKEEAERVLGNVFALLSLSSVVLFVFCYLFKTPILLLFGAGEGSLPYAEEYLSIYLFGTFFSMISTGLNGYINAQGFPKIGMLTTVLGAVLNIALDALFIYGFSMEVRGAALATVISQGVSCLWVLWFLVGKKAILRLKKEHFRISLKTTARICSLGLPAFVMQATGSLVQIVSNNQLQLYGGELGDLYVGVLAVIGSVRDLVTLPVMGISSGAQPVLGFNYGARRNDRVKEGIRFTTVIGTAYTIVAWVFIMLFPRALMALFTDSADTVRIGAEMMNLYFFGFFLMALQFAGQTTFQALGKAKKAVFFSLLRKALIVVPLTLLLPALGLGVKGVFLAEPISNAIGGAACFATMWITVYKKL
ncbi:MAG: MATE family efflux transporter [Clostridia bacterium]|nr:MATE family efflux transporter [Clostridia bacterium]